MRPVKLICVSMMVLASCTHAGVFECDGDTYIKVGCSRSKPAIGLVDNRHNAGQLANYMGEIFLLMSHIGR